MNSKMAAGSGSTGSDRARMLSRLARSDVVGRVAASQTRNFNFYFPENESLVLSNSCLIILGRMKWQNG
jgi:hypothetical protein